MNKRKVLVVDDSEIVLALTRSVLEASGLEVITLSNPLRVPAFVSSQALDLVLIDVNMPKVTGDLMVRLVKGRMIAKKALVVLLSDLPSSELEERAKLCGADGYIRKAEGTERLVEKVLRYLGPADSSR